MNLSLLLLFTLFCCIVIIIILVIKLNKKKTILEKVIIDKHDLEVLRKRELKEYFNEEWEQEKNKIDYERKVYESEIRSNQLELENKYKLDANKLDNEIKNLEIKLKEKETRYNEVNQDLDLYRKGKIEEIDSTAAEYEQRKQLEINQSLEQAKLAANSDFNNCVDAYIVQKTQMQTEIETIKSELEEERIKRATINEEIRRAREVEEQQDFYRIQLDPNDKDDVEILRSIAPRLRHPEAINKVIWTGYYQKPLAELRKRVGIENSGVYKITRIKTGEIYIGQAVNVSTRWAEHCKAALGVGTLASSQLHRVMASDGCENFTFELLEEVPKEKLRERESYYIDFYDSKIYGLNTVNGDKK